MRVDGTGGATRGRGLAGPQRWWIVPAAEFEGYRGGWDWANGAGPRSPLLDSAFVGALLKHFGTGEEYLALLGEPGCPVAGTIVRRRGMGRWDTFQPSQAPIGLWVRQPGLSAPGLLRSLLRSLPGFALRVGLSQLDPDLEARPSGLPGISTLDYIQTARVRVDGTFEEYWETRGKNLRHNVKRQRNKLSKEGVVTRLDVVSAPHDVEAAVRAYGALERAGWKSDVGTAVDLGEAQGRFYRDMLEAFCQRGEGRIYQYYYGSDLVATDLCVSGYGTLVILKTTYDERHTATSPATLMRQEQFKQIFDEGRFATIEFYGRLMEWHTRWTEDVRTMFHVNAYRASALGRASQAMARLVGRTRSSASTGPAAT